MLPVLNATQAAKDIFHGLIYCALVFFSPETYSKNLDAIGDKVLNIADRDTTRRVSNKAGFQPWREILVDATPQFSMLWTTGSCCDL